MMQEVTAVVMENIQMAVLSILGAVLTWAVTSVKSFVNEFLKSRTTEKQYDQLQKISYDIYHYVEREFGEKLHEKGAEKFNRALHAFEKEMAKRDLPFDAEDFKIQIEKIIQEEHGPFDLFERVSQNTEAEG